MTFTVGLNQKDNIDAAVQKVITMKRYHYYFISFTWQCIPNVIIFYAFISFQRIFKFCFSIMMVEQVSGRSLSGPSMQFISVLGSRPNGKTSKFCEF